MSPIDLSGKKAAIKTTWGNAEVFRTNWSKAQQAADKAAAGMPRAGQAEVQASAASGIYDAVDAQQTKLIAAGVDPAPIVSDLIGYADTLKQSADDYLIDAQTQIDNWKPGTAATRGG